MVRYPAAGVNGRPANIEDIVIDYIVEESESNDNLLGIIDDVYEDVYNNKDLMSDFEYDHQYEYSMYDSLDDDELNQLQMEESDYVLDVIGGVYTNSADQHVYNWPYDTAYNMAGDGWQNKLAEREYNSEEDVIKAFLNMSRMSLYDAELKTVRDTLGLN